MAHWANFGPYQWAQQPRVLDYTRPENWPAYFAHSKRKLSVVNMQQAPYSKHFIFFETSFIKLEH
jgi:hypothetical protein